MIPVYRRRARRIRFSHWIEPTRTRKNRAAIVTTAARAAAAERAFSAITTKENPTLTDPAQIDLEEAIAATADAPAEVDALPPIAGDQMREASDRAAVIDRADTASAIETALEATHSDLVAIRADLVERGVDAASDLATAAVPLIADLDEILERLDMLRRRDAVRVLVPVPVAVPVVVLVPIAVPIPVEIASVEPLVDVALPAEPDVAAEIAPGESTPPAIDSVAPVAVPPAIDSAGLPSGSLPGAFRLFAEAA